MNILQAKNEIKNTVKAYLSKNQFGEYEIDAKNQRPLLLIGPPPIRVNESNKRFISF